MGSAVRLFKSRLRSLASGRAAADMLFAPPGVAAGFANGADGRSRAHVSDCYEFAYVAKGRAKVVTPDRTFELTPKRVLLIASHVCHEERPARSDAPYVMFWCAVDENWARLDQSSYRPPGPRKAGPALELLGRTDVANIANAIAVELQNREDGWHRCAEGLLSYLSFILIRRLSRGSSKDPKPSESPTIDGDPRACRIIQSALAYCEAHFWERIRIKDVAEAVGYSPTYVGRLFASHLGHSVSEHLRRLRINAAKTALERSEAPVSEIAGWLGYRDPANFTHAFTRAAGVSPKTYRERLRGL